MTFSMYCVLMFAWHNKLSTNMGLVFSHCGGRFNTTDQAEGEEAFPVAAQPEGERSEQTTEAQAKTSSNPLTRVIGITRSNKGVLQGVNRFIRKQKKGFIDVWWLFDDGGKWLN